MSLKSAWDKNEHIQNALLEREQRWLSVLKTGNTSLSGLMKADFGTENPVGLDIDHWAGDTPISFQDAREATTYPDNKIHHWKFLGSVSWATPDKVNLHPVFNLLKKLPSLPFQSNATDMFSHETLHSRQGLEEKLGFYSLNHKAALIEKSPQMMKMPKKSVHYKHPLASEALINTP